MDHHDDSGQLTVTQAREQVRLLRDLLRQDARAQVHPATTRGDAIVMGWFEYPDGVWDGLWACRRVVGADRAYLETMQTLRDKPLDTLTLPEIGTHLTYLTNGERFSDGLIAGALDDGTCLALVERLAEWLGLEN